MPRWIAPGYLTALVLPLAGCGGSAAPDPRPSLEATADPASSTPAEVAPPSDIPASSAVSVGDSTDLSVDEETATYEFQFAYPAQAEAIPELKSWLVQRRTHARSDLETAAKADQQEAAKGDYPFRAHAYTANWQVVTDLPDWLSLSAETYMYTGGAHGMSGFNALLWDRKAGAMRKASDLFTSEDALSDALRKRFCAALDTKRIQRRGGPLDPQNTFSECIDPARQTILLGSSNGKTFDRIGFEIAPYEAGPYAEGSYEITLSVDGAVMRALRPQYRSSFSIPD